MHRPDAHLARLMESLSMSAVEKGSDNSKPPISQLSTRQPPPASSTPVPATVSSSKSYNLMEAVDASDWSSHAPRRVSDRQPSTTSQLLPPAGVPWAKPAYNPVHIDTSLSPSVFHSSAPYSLVSRPSSVSQSSVTSSSLRHQRSVSSLSSSSRSVETTPATKRMKQLALLESVADESARMTPTLEQQSGFHPIQVSSNVNGVNLPISRHPISIPPLQGSYSTSRQSVLYSSNLPSNFSPTRVPSVPATLPPLYSVVGDDPFKIRPRNGEMMLQTPSQYQMHNRIRQSMNETQLAPMLQRQQVQPSSSQRAQVPNYPPPHSYMLPTAAQSPHHPPHLPVRVPPLQLVSPQYLPISQSFASAPVSTPALLPHLSQPARNAQLLSILNANGPSHNPTGFQQSMNTPPVGVVTAVEHR
jgi:mRNA-decapping enzyme subunit 2